MHASYAAYIAAFKKGQKVRALNDRGNPPRIGTIVRLAGTRKISGLQGVLETKEMYAVEFMVPKGDKEVPHVETMLGDALVAVA